MTDLLVHRVDWAQQPSIHIACDGTWSTPRWGGKEARVVEFFGDEIGGIAQADSGHVYSFDEARITCPICLESKGKAEDLVEIVRQASEDGGEEAFQRVWDSFLDALHPRNQIGFSTVSQALFKVSLESKRLHHDTLYDLVAITWVYQRSLSGWERFHSAVGKRLDELGEAGELDREEYDLEDYLLEEGEEVSPMVEMLGHVLDELHEK